MVPGKSQTATDTAQSAVIAHDHLAINYAWLMIGGVLVLFMQAGFALVETGFTRAKNAAHTMMMNLVIFALGTVGWFVCGYALMFGSVSNGGLGITGLGSGAHVGDWQVVSHSGFFLAGHAYDVGILAFFFFQLVFMDATATIPTGAMAERFNFKGFICWGLFASMILYPVYGNWVWGGGFLSQLGTLGPKWGHGSARLRRLRRGPRHGRRGRLLGRQDPRRPHREVRQGRQSSGDPGPPPADGVPRHDGAARRAGWASTARRRSRRPTSASRS